MKDNGIGIAPEFLPHVFDRFRQADATSARLYGGLGLGLSIVRNIVELHGGSVRAESEGKDRGATFTVTLPIKQPAQASGKEDMDAKPINEGPATSASAPGARLDGVRVLVVDDDADTRDLLKVALTNAGAEVKQPNSFDRRGLSSAHIHRIA